MNTFFYRTPPVAAFVVGNEVGSLCKILLKSQRKIPLTNISCFVLASLYNFLVIFHYKTNAFSYIDQISVFVFKLEIEKMLRRSLRSLSVFKYFNKMLHLRFLTKS